MYLLHNASGLFVSALDVVKVILRVIVGPLDHNLLSFGADLCQAGSSCPALGRAVAPTLKCLAFRVAFLFRLRTLCG